MTEPHPLPNVPPAPAPSAGGPPGYAQPEQQPVGYGQYGQPGLTGLPAGYGPIGKVRPTGVTMLLYIVTLGIYGWYWWYVTHDEMKRHTGRGLGGGPAMVLGIFFGFVMAFFTPSEVGRLYSNRGQRPPVTGLTGLWATLGALIFVGPFIWFVKTNGALNEYWRSLGAQ
ncbi:MAG: DUF4234 domain-containing protein [Actinomycetota bacterium]|nr:DUF4234 domain-containing protein [Actinomycetota bacterium]